MALEKLRKDPECFEESPGIVPEYLNLANDVISASASERRYATDVPLQPTSTDYTSTVSALSVIDRQRELKAAALISR
jgi:hypothetical protein